MAARFKVTSAVIETEADFGDTKMNKNVLALEGVNGAPDYASVVQWCDTRKPQFLALEGDVVEADIVDQKGGGLKTKQLRKVGHGEVPPAEVPPAPLDTAETVQADAVPSNSEGYVDYEAQRTRSIQAQVALKVAGAIAASHAASTGTWPSANEIVELAEGLERFFRNPDDDIPF